MSKRSQIQATAIVPHNDDDAVLDPPPAGKSETLPDEEPYDESPAEEPPPGPTTEYAPPPAEAKIVTPTWKALTKEVALAENARIKARANLDQAEDRLRQALGAVNQYTARGTTKAP